MNETMNIGQAAKAAGVSAKMIRHYERIGLLPQAERNDSGYRLYRERDVSLLRFIRQSRSMGLSVPQIAELTGMWGDASHSSRTVKAMAQCHIANLEGKLREIAEMKTLLEMLVKDCSGNDQAD
ncbi:MerR family DNA-binding transcriptional regulator [Comamonadaceae bacterium G21597-S1]|nr:MerR family DNA-binding transcriptional regulator [Comamonadaceae bacterium G21597-S1]